MEPDGTQFSCPDCGWGAELKPGQTSFRCPDCGIESTFSSIPKPPPPLDTSPPQAQPPPVRTGFFCGSNFSTALPEASLSVPEPRQVPCPFPESPMASMGISQFSVIQKSGTWQCNRLTAPSGTRLA